MRIYRRSRLPGAALVDWFAKSDAWAVLAVVVLACTVSVLGIVLIAVLAR